MEKLRAFSLKKFYWKDYLTILLGTFMYALGVTQFIMPHKFVLGGLTGIAVLFNYAFGLPVSVQVLVMNAILLLIAYRTLGSEFLVKTVVGVASLSFFIGMFESFQLPTIMTQEPLMAGLIGSIVAGSGVGLVMSVNGSTGGTDIIILIINKYRNVTPGRMMLFIDMVIVTSSFVLFRSVETIVYGIIIIAVVSTSVDWILNGIRQSVQFFIVSQRYEDIANEINIQLNRGCTVLDGTGWYTQKPQKVLLVMAKRSESNSIFRLVKSIDSSAFISQANVNGVYGKGFDRMR
ncbi:MAG: YitT family protein [Fermentimonas sp.]|nr:YitT family protein [Fermentimonas sp.]MDD4696372.1 YitT family protein [Fermentimonas sp.]